MTSDQHSILKRQLAKLHKNNGHAEPNLDTFLESVNNTYFHFDDERKLLERSLDISSQELIHRNAEIQAIFKAFPDIFIRINKEGQIIDFKHSVAKDFHSFPERIVGKSIQDIFPTYVYTKLHEIIRQVNSEPQLYSTHYSLKNSNDEYHYEARLQPLLNEEIVIIIRNITEQKNAEAELLHNALHDKLTGLPNRALFMDRLKNLIRRAKRNSSYMFAVLFVDLDRFKNINDSLGHLIGDQLLIEISRRLENCISARDTVARLGGDEFTILLDDVKNEKNAYNVTERIQKEILLPLALHGENLFVSASIGIAICSPENASPDDMLREADTSMYRAKSNGSGRIEIFNKDMHERAMTMLSLESDLRRAIQANEFELYYQPIISLKNKKVIRMEALIRWNHPEKGIIMPLDFIPLAEETGLILDIGKWVIYAACKQSHIWASMGHSDVNMAVNFSALQFQNPNLPNLIKSILKETNANPITLEIELTESTAMGDVDHSVSMFNQLKNMGITIAIDDFGMGYSSLSCLRIFPIDALKIDRSFIHDIPNRQDNVSITKAIIGLSHNLGLKVVAEGIETLEQYEFLTKLNTDEGQGYLFSHPLPANLALDYIIDNKIK